MAASFSLIGSMENVFAEDRADPRTPQLFIMIPVFLDLVLVGILEERLAHTTYLVGMGVFGVASILAWTIYALGVPLAWSAVVPLIDIWGLAVLSGSNPAIIDFLIVLPAMWLGVVLRTAGVVLSGVMALFVFGIPTILAVDGAPRGWAHALQIMFVTVVSSGLVSLTVEAWRKQMSRSAKANARLEAAVAEGIRQRRRNEAIVSSVDVGLVSLDHLGRYEAMNPRHRDFMALAYPDGHYGVAGQLGYVYAADGRTELIREDMPTIRAVRGETFRNYTIWVGADPAERRALAVSGTPYHDTDGTFAGAVLAYHDITELVAALRVKDEFIATVSHELRTPLTSIIGYVDLVLEEWWAVNGEQRHHLMAVQRNAHRLHRLVGDLLGSADGPSLSMKDVERVPVDRLVQAAATEAEAESLGAGHDLRFTHSSAGGDFAVSGDAGRLSQVFDNLFSNAVKYTPDGGSITSSVYRKGGQVVAEVTDTGRGIPADELENIFQRFFRTSDVQAEAIPGVGLGLAICKQIVDAHGGHIWVTSEPGAGTTVEVALPYG